MLLFCPCRKGGTLNALPCRPLLLPPFLLAALVIPLSVALLSVAPLSVARAAGGAILQENLMLGELPVLTVPLRENDARRRLYQPQGVMLGSWRLDGQLEEAITHDDNLFVQGSAPQEDWISTTRLDLSLHRDPPPWGLGAFVQASGVNYLLHDQLSYQNHSVGLTFKGDAANRSRLEGALSLSRRHELPGDPTQAGAPAAPVAVDDLQLTGAYLLRRGWWLAGGGLMARRLDFHDSRRRDGLVLEQDDRDRADIVLETRSGLVPLPTVELWNASRYSLHTYDHPSALLGIERLSSRQDSLVGFTLDLSERLAAEAGYGIMRNGYLSPYFTNLNRRVWTASAALSLTPLTTVRLKSARQLEETASEGYAGVLVDRTSLGVEHELLRSLVLHVDGSHENRQLFGLLTRRTDDIYTLRPAGEYRFDNRWYVGLEGQYSWRDSSEAGGACDRTMLTLKMGARL